MIQLIKTDACMKQHMDFGIHISSNDLYQISVFTSLKALDCIEIKFSVSSLL